MWKLVLLHEIKNEKTLETSAGYHADVDFNFYDALIIPKYL